MTYAQLVSLLNSNVTPPVNDSQKVADNDKAVLDYVLGTQTEEYPDWAASLTFNLDGTADGKYCKHPSTEGNKRIFETKTNGNINNPPPTNPAVTENTYWIEISPSLAASIPEYAPGVFGSGLKLVFYANNILKLEEPVRPFTSTNILTEMAAGKWINLTGKTILTVDVSSSTPTINLINLIEAKLNASATINANKTFSLSNASNVFQFTFIFTLTASLWLQWPTNFKMSDALWNSTTKRWQPEQGGTYLAVIEADGAGGFLLTISNPFT